MNSEHSSPSTRFLGTILVAFACSITCLVAGSEPAGATVSRPAPFSVQYGPETLETAVVYPAITTDAPIIVLVHGGGFRSSANANLELTTANALQADGFAVFDANYSDDAGGAFPLQPNDIVSATNAARAAAPSYNGNPSRVTLLGGSSGGLLVALAAEDLDNAGTPVQHVITLSAPFDFPTLMAHWASLNDNTGRIHLDKDQRALNCYKATCTFALEAMWSPYGHVNSNTRATSWLLFNGTSEVMPRQQTDYMTQDQAIFGVSRIEDVFSDTAHAFAYFGVVRAQIDFFARQ